MDEIIIKQKQSKQFGFVILGAIFLYISLGMLLFETSIILRIVGLIGTLFFGICFIFIILRFIKPKDILVINQEGFVDNSTAVSIGFISWKYVDRICIKTNSVEKLIVIDINNDEQVFKNVSKIKMIFIELNKKLGYSPISISLSPTNVKYMDIIQKMQKYFETYEREKI